MSESYESMSREELLKAIHILNYKYAQAKKNYHCMAHRCMDLKAIIIVVKKQLENICKNIYYNKDTKTHPTKVVYFKSGTNIRVKTVVPTKYR